MVLVKENKRLKKSFNMRKMSLFEDDTSFVQNGMYSNESKEIFQLSGHSSSVHYNRRSLTTFSPENGDSNGTVNTSFIANGEKDIEKNGNEVERESDGEDQRGSTAGNVYI